MVEYSIGVIGGSGLYGMEGLQVHQERVVETPFGEPSAPFVLGEIEGQKVAFLARHGQGHRLMPTELNFRANIFAFKLLGAERLISVSAVGSLQEQYAPTHVVVPDQFVDRTRHRVDTFFGDGLVAHVSLADPICPHLSAVLGRATESTGTQMHFGGTYLCMEGPQFSTRAESHLYRQWGMDIIGMTNLQEARLAREAEICYSTLAMVTDYDCWHEAEEDVTVDAVIAILRQNAATAQGIIKHAVVELAAESTAGSGGGRSCLCCNALASALITDPSMIPEATRRRLDPIVGRYLGSAEDAEPAT